MTFLSLVIGLAVCGDARPACTCAPGGRLAARTDVAATVDAFAAVFEGAVIRTVYRDGSLPTIGQRGERGTVRVQQLEVTFAVDRQWKGAPANTVTVRTPAFTESCGARFDQGHSYLVFAATLDDTGISPAPPARAREAVYTTKCSPTMAVGAESLQIESLLGPPSAPTRAARRPDAPEA